MRLGIILRGSDAGVRHEGSRIEHPEPKACHEQAVQRTVDVRFRQQPLTNCAENRSALGTHSIPIVSADEIHSGLERRRNTLFRGW